MGALIELVSAAPATNSDLTTPTADQVAEVISDNEVEKPPNGRISRCWHKSLSRDGIIAGPHYNRWLFPAAACLVNMGIGQAFAYSIFIQPMSTLCKVGECENWPVKRLEAVFPLFFIVLGLTAGICSRRLEALGPRVAGILAAIFWGGGFFIAAMGVKHHVLMAVIIGNGVIGGMGMAFGYTSSISTLMKWFPDRPGTACGLAIMGLTAGGLYGAPLARQLMERGYDLWKIYIIFGAIAMAAILVGTSGYRVPAEGWRPKGWKPTAQDQVILTSYVDARESLRTFQFWILWIDLAVTTVTGFFLLTMASNNVQYIYNVPPILAGAMILNFIIFNTFGRLGWATVSDYVGRFHLLNIFFIMGVILYAYAPQTVHAHNFNHFLACYGIMYSIYGGTFASMPAYVRDVFGDKEAGGIHSRLLTAWSAGAILGPFFIKRVRNHVDPNHPMPKVSDLTLYLGCVLMFGALIVNLLLPIINKHVPFENRRMDEEVSVVVAQGEERDIENGDVGDEVEAKEDEPLKIETVVVAVGEGPSSRHKTLLISIAMGIFAAMLWCIPLAGMGWGLNQIHLMTAKAYKFIHFFAKVAAEKAKTA